jgi:ABC-type antimicrobial peptide transport system permease subunit
MRATIRIVRILGLALLTLGILGGVHVLVLAEIGEASKTAVAQTLKSMGVNNLLVMPGTGTTLTADDAAAIAEECRPAVVSVAPVVRARTQVVNGNRNWAPLFIYGTTPSFLDIREWLDLEEGEPFTDADVRNCTRVCLVGQTIKRELFNGQSPLNREVRLQNVDFKVVGVLSARGANMMGLDQDDIVLAPWTTIKARVSGSTLTNVNQNTSATAPNTTATTGNPANSLNPSYPSAQDSIYPTIDPVRITDSPQQTRFPSIDQIMVRANSAEEIPFAIRRITDLLRQRHHIKPGQPDDFSIRDTTELSTAVRASTATMTWSLLFAALIPLAAGGAGILLFMLGSVTARTRAIGLRLAAGARPGYILRQLLMEASLLGLAGGIIAILLGRLGSYLVWRCWSWSVEPSLPAVVVALVASIGVGLIFGCYPAWKASLLRRE